MKKQSSQLPQNKLKELLGAAYIVCMLDPALDRKSLERIEVAARAYARRRIGSLGLQRRSVMDHDALGRLIFRWQRSPNYLDEEGQPVPLRARGPAPSLEALFRAGKIEKYFELGGLKHLQQSGLVRRTKNGQYVPRSEAMIVPTLTPEIVEVLAKTINRLLFTALQNTAIGDRKAIRLIERVTAVPNFPKKDLMAFKQFAMEQGGVLITTVNDWLETRRAKQRSSAMRKEPLTAGLHVFAFIEKD